MGQRYLRVNEPVFPHGAAFPARRRQRERCRLGQGACFHLRDPPDEYLPTPCDPRCGRSAQSCRGRGAGLGRRHADRSVPARFQPRLVAPGDGAGCGGASHHRRSGPRRCGSARERDGAPAPVLAPSDLAEPALALGRVCAQGYRNSRDAAACGQLSCGSFDPVIGRTCGGDFTPGRSGRKGPADGHALRAGRLSVDGKPTRVDACAAYPTCWCTSITLPSGS